MRVVFEDPVALRPVVVARFTTPVEAAIAQGALAREGIEAELRDDALVGIAWHLSNAVGGVKLVVRPADALLAREALEGLDRLDAELREPPQDLECALPARHGGRWAARAFALLLAAMGLAAALP